MSQRAQFILAMLGAAVLIWIAALTTDGALVNVDASSWVTNAQVQRTLAQIGDTAACATNASQTFAAYLMDMNARRQETHHAVMEFAGKAAPTVLGILVCVLIVFRKHIDDWRENRKLKRQQQRFT